jgi:hypothetical protein
VSKRRSAWFCGWARLGLARVEAGPQLVVSTPVAGGYLPAAAGRRQRIAGNALPASGTALPLGMDF